MDELIGKSTYVCVCARMFNSSMCFLICGHIELTCDCVSVRAHTQTFTHSLKYEHFMRKLNEAKLNWVKTQVFIQSDVYTTRVQAHKQVEHHQTTHTHTHMHQLIGVWVMEGGVALEHICVQCMTLDSHQ